MSSQWQSELEESRRKLLDSIGDAQDVAVFRGYGNLGDELIVAGTRQLLRDVSYREYALREVKSVRGSIALIGGSGGWCAAHSDMPKYALEIESRFERVIILPSSFDTGVEAVLSFLAKTRAIVFARERVSYDAIQSLCQAELAHDCAFFFDFSPYRCKGAGTLHAYRTDAEAAFSDRPEANNDISETCENLDHWLWTIAKHRTVRTDRAHVMIAAALLGKVVEWRPNNYHKVGAIAEFALQGLDIRESVEQENTRQNTHRNDAGKPASASQDEVAHMDWQRNIWLMIGEVGAMIPPGTPFLLADEDQVRAEFSRDFRVVPFLERNRKYWGAPEDDSHGIRELDRMRGEGARYIVFAWPAFWWLTYYSELREHLETNHRRVLENSRVVIYYIGC